jgi:hypothetical protein
MEAELTPIRARAAHLRENPEEVADALATGTRRCREWAGETVGHARERMGID